MISLLLSLSLVTSPKHAEQLSLAGKPMVKAMAAPLLVIPPPAVLGLAWDPSVTPGVILSTVYYGADSLTYQWHTNVPSPASTVSITSTNAKLYLVVTVTDVLGRESGPSPEITTFLPANNLTNALNLNFTTYPKYRMESATKPAGPWAVYGPTTNWIPSTGSAYYRMNWSY